MTLKPMFLRKLICGTLAALSLLPLSMAPALADAGLGTRVPLGTSSGQTLRWDGTNWTIGGVVYTGMTAVFPGAVTIPTTIAVGGTGDGSAGYFAPSGTGQPGVKIVIPAAYTGLPFSIYSSTNKYLAGFDANGDINLGQTALSGGTPGSKGISIIPGAEIIRGAGSTGNSTQANITLDPTGYSGGVLVNTLVSGATTLGSGTYEFVTGGGTTIMTPRSPGALGMQFRANGTGDLLQLQNSTGSTVNARWAADGTVIAPSFSPGGITPYTGNIPMTALNTHVKGGIIVGYTATDGSTVGN